MSEHPPTRWEQLGDTLDSPYARAHRELPGPDRDVDGEARLADVLLPRGGRVLDAGAGIARVSHSLLRRGHDVTAVEKDPALIAVTRELYPEVTVVESDILALTPALLEAHGRPTAYDVVVVVGNVMIYLADDTEVIALRTLAALLVPGGRLLVGFHPQEGPPGSRDYPVATFLEHVRAAGLQADLVAGTWDLRPPSDDYVLAVLSAAPTGVTPEVTSGR